MQRQANLVYSETLKLSFKWDADEGHDLHLKRGLRGLVPGKNFLLGELLSCPGTLPFQSHRHFLAVKIPQCICVTTVLWLEELGQWIYLFSQHSLVCPFDSCLRSTVAWKLDWVLISGWVWICQVNLSKVFIYSGPCLPTDIIRLLALLLSEIFLGFPGGSYGKESTSIQEIQAWSLEWEDPLEDWMATHPSILMDNSMDRGAWWATIHGVPRSQTDWVTNNFIFFPRSF